MSAAADETDLGSTVAALPWDELFRTAVLGFRLRPQDVWRLTLREVGMLLAPAGGSGAAHPSRTELLRLIERFPDD